MLAIAWLLLSIIWGATWLAVRVGLEDLPPMTFAGIRFLVATGVLGTVLVVRRIPLPRTSSDWMLILQTALLAIGVTYSLQFWGQQYVPSGLTAVMFSTVPLFTMVLAHVSLPSEPFTRAGLAGVVLGILGVLLILSDQLGTDNPLAVWGCLGFLVGSLSMSRAQVTVKARGGHLDPTVLATTQMAIGGTVLLGIGLATEGNPLSITWTIPAIASLSYLALVGSALALFLFYWLLRHMAVTKVMSMALVHPLVAVLLGWLVLGESLGWRVFVGGGGVLAGLALILSRATLPIPVSTGSQPRPEDVPVTPVERG